MACQAHLTARIAYALLLASAANAQVQYIALHGSPDLGGNSQQHNIRTRSGYRLFGYWRETVVSPMSVGYLDEGGFVPIAQEAFFFDIPSIDVAEDGSAMLFTGSASVKDGAGAPLPTHTGLQINHYLWTDSGGIQLLPRTAPVQGTAPCDDLRIDWRHLSGDGRQLFGIGRFHDSTTGLVCPGTDVIPFECTVGGQPSVACWWPALRGTVGDVNFDGTKVLVHVPGGGQSVSSYHVDQCAVTPITGGFVDPVWQTWDFIGGPAAAISSQGDKVALAGPDGLMSWSPVGGGVLLDSSYIPVRLLGVTDDQIRLLGSVWTAAGGLQSTMEFLTDLDSLPDGSGPNWVASAGAHVARGSSNWMGGDASNMVVFFGEARPGCFGRTFCGIPNWNSTGLWANVNAVGSPELARNDLSLRASNLPPNQLGIVLSSRGTALSPVIPASEGALCLGGGQFIGRHNRPGELGLSGPSGEFTVHIDNTNLPAPGTPIAAQAGETWYFQVWYRDFSNGQGTSNFTDAVAVTFE